MCVQQRDEAAPKPHIRQKIGDRNFKAGGRGGTANSLYLTEVALHQCYGPGREGDVTSGRAEEDSLPQFPDRANLWPGKDSTPITELKSTQLPLKTRKSGSDRACKKTQTAKNGCIVTHETSMRI